MRKWMSLGCAASLAFAAGCGKSSKSEPAGPTEPPGIDGGSVVAPNPTPAADVTDGRYTLESQAQLGECLTAQPDDAVATDACQADRPSQLWMLTAVTDGVFRVESGSSGRALDSANSGTEAGTDVLTWPYGDGAPNRQFALRDGGDATVEFEAVHAPGMCLAVSADGGAELQPCGVSDATRWALFRVTQAPSIGRGLDTPGCVSEPALAVQLRAVTQIAELGRPFDPSAEDLVGPHDWNTNYGKHPEVVAIPAGTGIDVLYRDQDVAHRGFLVHLEPSDTGLMPTAAFEVGLLDTVMGLARDDAGNRFFATGVDEGDSVDATTPPDGIHRPDIVRVVAFDEAGCVRLEVDLDLARGYREAGSELIINPMTAATSRLAFGNGTLALLHGINTEPDTSGTRHQKALTTHLDVASGEVVRTSSMWVSHSFDQRLFWDGAGFVELHLGDTYPRGLVFGRFTPDDGAGGYLLLRPKGSGNATYTRLGGVAPIAAGDYGYLVVFTTDRSPEVDAPGDSRDLALVRVRRDFSTLDSSTAEVVDPAGATQVVTSGDAQVTNHLVWLTTYGADESADRPRLVALDGDRYVAIWEHWTGDTFEGTWALTLDGSGQVVVDATRISGDHLPRGDDAVRLGSEAAVVFGAGSGLAVGLVSADLVARRVAVP